MPETDDLMKTADPREPALTEERLAVLQSARAFIGKIVSVEIDRPVGYVHRKETYSLTYPINYGFVPGIFGGDGEELDVYLLGTESPVKNAKARVIAVAHRRNDVEDKLIATTSERAYTVSELYDAVRFQEQWYDTVIITNGSEGEPLCRIISY